MEKRAIGKSGIMVAPFALGGNVFGWTIDEETSFKILDAFVAGGFNLVDTADVYSTWKKGNTGGESETIIGNWMKKRNNRNSVVIATKVGGDMGSGKTLKKNYIIKAAEDSLKRLQTDHIDLYQTHWDDIETPVEEILEAYEQLISQGKVRTIGASNVSPERLKESLEKGTEKNLPLYSCLQPEYNLYDREKYEMEFETLCLKNDLGVISYYSLASGFLTGKYRNENDISGSTRGGGIKKYLNERGTAILNALDIIAGRYQTTPAAISLAWLIARPSITAPISSATSIAQLQQLMHAADLNLTPEDILLLNEASAWNRKVY